MDETVSLAHVKHALAKVQNPAPCGAISGSAESRVAIASEGKDGLIFGTF